MGGWLKRQGIDCNDNKTWGKYDAKDLHMSKTILGMMNTGPACFSRYALFFGYRLRAVTWNYLRALPQWDSFSLFCTIPTRAP